VDFEVDAIVYFSYLALTVLMFFAIRWIGNRGLLPSYPMPVWMIGALTISAVAFSLISFKISTPPDRYHDFFFAYYPAGQAIANHDPAALRVLTDRGVSGFVNIPVVAYLFAPLGALDPATAVAIFTALGVAASLAAWFLLVRLAQPEPRELWLFTLLFLANGPLWHGLKFGNTSHFILLAMALSLVLMRARRHGMAGALMGAAAVIKPPLVLFGAFFALRRDIPGLLGFVGVGAATVLLSLILFGWADNLHWFQVSVLEYSRGWLGGYNVQSIPGFFQRLHSESRLDDWQPHIPTGAEKLAARVCMGVIFVAGIATALASSLRAKRFDPSGSIRRELQFSLVICLCLIGSPLAWSHYYVWLLIPTALFLRTPSPFPAWPLARWIGWIAIILVTPLVEWPWSITNSRLMEAYRSFGVSHLLFGGLLWFGLICWWLLKVDETSKAEAYATQPETIGKPGIA
jgi:alpha-1,2-mannosyltransferase